MVRPGGDSGPPRGFTLVELVVAMVVLTVGVLGAVATAALALRTLREAETEAGAVRFAGAVLDSLLQLPAVGAGERSEDRYHARWSAHRRGRAAALELAVEYEDGTRPRRLVFDALHVPPLLPLDGL